MNKIEVKTLNYLLQIDLFRNSSQKLLGGMMCEYWVFGGREGGGQKDLDGYTYFQEFIVSLSSNEKAAIIKLHLAILQQVIQDG